MTQKWTIVVPARLQSTRLPKKPLVDLNGKPLIVRVLENLSPLQSHNCRLITAVDDETVLKVVSSFGFEGVMTSVHHESGTDRCLEAISIAQRKQNTPGGLDETDFIINVQGDEPFVSIEDLKNLMTFTETSRYQMNTMFAHTHDMQTVLNPNVVKVLVRDAKALYFSRAPIPFPRDYSASNHPILSKYPYLLHMGIYSFTRTGLQSFCSLPKSTWEETEMLEQLRWIQSGHDLGMLQCSKRTLGIDTPEDLIKAREMIETANSY
jgi:3-deoxy-manno-octulosonate cytidylyltransferase (CMP-KDO synthetase)